MGNRLQNHDGAVCVQQRHPGDPAQLLAELNVLSGNYVLAWVFFSWESKEWGNYEGGASTQKTRPLPIMSRMHWDAETSSPLLS